LNTRAPHPDLTSFPTRRSSDLRKVRSQAAAAPQDSAQGWSRVSRILSRIIWRFLLALPRPLAKLRVCVSPQTSGETVDEDRSLRDRKSTRLNSSHLGISYAVFC